jgi:Tetratricopeptide repeat
MHGRADENDQNKNGIMMKEFDYDRINSYLDGEMDATEKTAFEAVMQEDAGLKNEVTLLQEVNETLRMKLHPGKNETALLHTMEDLRGEYFPGRKVHRIVPFRRTGWMAAAAAVFILVIMFAIWQPWQKDLYRQYADTEMPAVAERGGPADVLLKQATEYFNHKDYAGAITACKAILKDDPQNTYVQYYYAIALMQNNQVNDSRNGLMLLFKGESLFKYNAAFYLALSYLKENNKPTFGYPQYKCKNQTEYAYSSLIILFARF